VISLIGLSALDQEKVSYAVNAIAARQYHINAWLLSDHLFLQGQLMISNPWLSRPSPEIFLL
jgi:hypothetical protein